MPDEEEAQPARSRGFTRPGDERCDRMENLRSILDWAFHYVLYPLVLVGIFVAIGDMLRMVLSAASDRLGKIRRLTGAVLPWVILVFLFILGSGTTDSARPWIETLSWWHQLVIGAVVGLCVMEIGKLLMRSGGNGTAALYALVVSSLGAFLVWMIMEGILQSVHFALLGLVTAAALHVIFRGPPEVRPDAAAPNDRPNEN